MSTIGKTTHSVPWRRPTHVTLDGAYLVADVKGEMTYELLRAAKDGRALQDLIDADTDEAVCQFTRRWGFLHTRFESGRRDRFPLQLFRQHQQYFLALARLCKAVRTEPNDIEEITAALRVLTTSRDARTGCASAARIPTAGADRLADRLTDRERQLLTDQVVPVQVLLEAHTEERDTSAISIPEYAARTIAFELSADLLSHLQPVRLSANKRQQRKRGSWIFKEVPILFTLEQVLRWTIRSRLDTLHHFFCASCGREQLGQRADQQYCNEKCAGRTRALRWRQSHPKPSARGRGRTNLGKSRPMRRTPETAPPRH